jgi:hypothetical protein
MAPEEAYLWCHRCKEELLHASDTDAYVCSVCANRKHPAEVMATYCTWDDHEVPPALLLPIRLLTTPDAAMRYRLAWLEEEQETLDEYRTLMREVFTADASVE